MPVLLLIIVWLIPPDLAGAESYRYVDKDGVVSFTDDLGKVPESERPRVQTIEPHSPSGLGRETMPDPVPGPGRKWVGRRLLGPFIMLVALSILMFFVQSRTDSVLLRLAVKLLFIGFLGALVYSALIQAGSTSLEERGKEISTKAHAIEERLKGHDAALDAISSSSSEPSANTNH